MPVNRGHHFAAKWIVPVFACMLTLVLLLSAAAQTNGVPASVTSIGFGGNFNRIPGVAASLTSIGPFGLIPSNGFVPPTSFVGPNNLIIPNNFVSNPFLRARPHVPFFAGNRPFFAGHNRRDHNRFFNGGVAVVPVPYAVPVAVPYEVEDYGQDSSEQASDSEYQGGPTIFDRRGAGPAMQPSAPPAPQEHAEAAPPASEPAPVVEQPTTVLVFNDGHQLEIQNYAIIGDTLFDMTPGHRRRIQLSALNLQATSQTNEDRGVDFAVPGPR